MSKELIIMTFAIGTPLCLADGLIAFLTTYAGYTRGQNPDKRLAMRMALRTAIAALFAFDVLVACIAFFLVKVVLK